MGASHDQSDYRVARSRFVLTEAVPFVLLVAGMLVLPYWLTTSGTLRIFVQASAVFGGVLGYYFTRTEWQAKSGLARTRSAKRYFAAAIAPAALLVFLLQILWPDVARRHEALVSLREFMLTNHLVLNLSCGALSGCTAFLFVGALTLNLRTPAQSVSAVDVASRRRWQTKLTESEGASDFVFISYCHADSAWMERLVRMLAPLLRKGSLSVWADTGIREGAKWQTEIESAIAQSRIAVLLVSAHFFASEFIMDTELPALMKAEEEGDLRILWLPVGSSLYRESALAEYQALHDPENPLETLGDAERDKALAKICGKIKVAASVEEPAAEKQA